MDIVHHAFVGGMGLIAAAETGIPEAGLTFLLGSAVPDLDVLFMLFGKRVYLRNHQGITHSVLAAPVLAALLCIPFLIFFERSWDWLLFGGAAAGLSVHYLLDWFNTYGLKAFAPLSGRRYRLNATFFIDSVTWALTGLAYLWWWLDRSLVPVIVYVGLAVVYHIGKLLLYRAVRAATQGDHVVPSSLDPFMFYILEKHDGFYSAYLYNGVTKRKHKEETIPFPDQSMVALARKSSLYQDMQTITRELVITDTEETAAGIRLTARDLAVRNYGGKFGTTVLEFDSEGYLLHEMAHI